MTTIRPGFPHFPKLILGKSPIHNPRNPKLAGAPVVFSAQTTLTSGKSAVLNAQTLQSGFRTGYFIDEIRVSMFTEPFAGATNSGITGLSGLVSILFQTGKYYFSTDAVPVGLLAPMFGQDYGRAQVNASVTSDNRNFAAVRWMLPKPLFMPAGDVVLANVSLATLALLGSTGVTVTVTYVGRLVPQGYIAKSREVPWLAWWTKDMATSYADSTTKFRNPFKKPAHVQRFTQRTYISKAANPLAQYNEASALGQIASTADPYETIKINDSRGYAITNKFVAIGDVFDPSRHAWTFGRELSSREQFNMQMTTVNIGAIGAGFSYITNIGLVGYRSEAP